MRKKMISLAVNNHEAKFKIQQFIVVLVHDDSTYDCVGYEPHDKT